MQLGPNAYDQPPPNKRTQLTDIPVERLLDIVNYVPAFQRFGTRRLSFISKAFQNYIPSETSFEELYESCLREPEGVLYLLSHPTCLSHFTTIQLLQLVSCHLTLAVKVLELLPEIPFALSTYFSILGANPEVAKYILANFDEYAFESEDDLTLFEIFSQMHQEIALLVLRTYLPLNPNFLAYQIVNIARYHEVAAEEVLNTEVLFNQLADDDLACLVYQHERLAMHVLDTPELCERMGIFELSILGRKHLSVAKRILQEHADRFREPDLIELCGNNPLIAQEIINDPLLVAKLSEESLVFMTGTSETLALTVIRHPTLSQTLSAQSLITLGVPYPIVVNEIQKTPGLNGKLNTLQQLMLLCHSPELQHKLSDPNINHNLNGDDLVTLSQYSLSSMKMILSTPELYHKLDANHLTDMGTSGNEIFLMIQQNPELWGRLETEHLLEFHQQYPRLSATLLQSNQLPDIERIRLNCENNLCQHIHAIAKDIYVPSEAMVAARTRPMLRRR